MTSTFKTPLRKPTWSGNTAKPSDVGNLARDIADRLDGQPRLYVVPEFVDIYREPMYVSLPANPSVGIVALRIRVANKPETPVLTGSMCEWSWVNNRARIDSIDGMSIGSGKLFIFNLLAVG